MRRRACAQSASGEELSLSLGSLAMMQGGVECSLSAGGREMCRLDETGYCSTARSTEEGKCPGDDEEVETGVEVGV